MWCRMENAFCGCSNREINASDTPDVSEVTIMRAMFKDANLSTRNYDRVQVMLQRNDDYDLIDLQTIRVIADPDVSALVPVITYLLQ